MDPAKEPPTDWQAFEPYTAKRMTEKLCRFFDERLEAEDAGFRGKGLRIEDRGLRKGELAPSDLPPPILKSRSAVGGLSAGAGELRMEDLGLRSEDRGLRDLGVRIQD